MSGKSSETRRDERFEGGGWQKAVMHGIQKRARRPGFSRQSDSETRKRNEQKMGEDKNKF